MFAKHVLSVAVAVLMVSSIALGGVAASSHSVESSEAQAETRAGTHVTFETTADALAHYSIEGTELVSSVETESASDAEQRGALGVDVGLSTVTSVEAAPISVNAETGTQVEIESESGAVIESHDSQRGHLLVSAQDGDQLVAANVSGDAEAEQESESRVVVTNEDGTQGTFIVVGDGEVTVNDDGHVTAEVAQGGSLTYQQYEGERTDEDEEREELIADGTAAAEVYVTMAAEDGSEAAADVVEYGQDTTVEVTTYSENQIEMTAERTECEGRIIIASVSDRAFETAEDIEVLVDGEAAVHVESTSELEAAAAGGDESAYSVRSASTAESSSEVLVGINHFSERDVTMNSGEEAQAGDDDRSTSADDDDGTADGDDDEMPGFGIAIAGLVLLTSGLLAARRAQQ